MHISIDKYASQQLITEPSVIRDLKHKLGNAHTRIINAQDLTTGHPTLYTAVRAGNVEAGKILTEQGTDLDLSQRTKRTALHAVSSYGHGSVVLCLLKSGADYRIKISCGNKAEDEAFNYKFKQLFAELQQNAYIRVAANELD